MQIDNATNENITCLQSKIKEMAQTNPALESRVYKMEEQPSNAKIFEKLEAIERLLKHIFDDHIIINGKFKSVRVYNKALHVDR